MGLILAGVAMVVGCDAIGTDSSRWFDKSAVVKAPTNAPMRPIEQGVGPADYTPEVVPNSNPPREEDLVYRVEDYVMGPTDVIDITVLDLYEPGQEAALRKQVSQSGYIDLPLVGLIKAEGLTASQLKQAVINAYSPDVLRNPTVSVSVVAERQNQFTALGAVARPGPYPIPRKDTKLLEALGMAGGVVQTNIRHIYVIRPAPSVGIPGEVKAPTTGQAPGEAPSLPSLPALPSLPPLPGTETTAPAAPATGSTGNDAALKDINDALTGKKSTTTPAPSVFRFSMEGGGPASATGTAPADEAELKRAIKDPMWVNVAGQTTRMAEDSNVPATQPSSEGATTRKSPDTDPFGWHKVDKSDQARIIAINLKKLQDGSPAMNIIIRNNDIVWVPPLEMGEFYVMGEVLRPGVYSLAGRRVTVKMAIAAAGNLGPLSDPKNAILIRRIGENQEQMFPLDIDAIFRSQENDMFLKPDDVIAVGQSWASPFLLVFRNAFRMTYGFGWIWDRNFADPMFNPELVDHNRFARW